jgi:hypothetical protein
MNNLQAAQEQWDGRTPMDDDDQIQIGDTTWDGEIELWADSIDWLNIDMVLPLSKRSNDAHQRD